MTGGRLIDIWIVQNLAHRSPDVCPTRHRLIYWRSDCFENRAPGFKSEFKLRRCPSDSTKWPGSLRIS